MLRRMSIGKRVSLTLMAGLALMFVGGRLGNWMIELGVATVVILGSVYVVRSITRPVREAALAAEAIAAGDLRVEIEDEAPALHSSLRCQRRAGCHQLFQQVPMFWQPIYHLYYHRSE